MCQCVWCVSEWVAVFRCPALWVFSVGTGEAIVIVTYNGFLSRASLISFRPLKAE